ncbi:MAG: prolyl oligopeptidase family serine peptidase, partial [Planctomycetales bacterium]|nr:prolyl oligopeptidase family serine peptidase [Planctomycetales bacterium]
PRGSTTVTITVAVDPATRGILTNSAGVTGIESDPSPANNADKIRSALMVVHGRNDPRVPFSEAEQIAAKVRGNGRQVWTVYADNEGHGFAKKVNRDYQTAAVVMFLREHLK